MDNVDFEQLSKDEKKYLITKLMDAELEKPYQEVDSDFITECVDCLLDLDGIDAELSVEEVERRVNDIAATAAKRTADKIEYSETEKSASHIKLIKPAKKPFRKLVLLAACITIFALTASFVAIGKDSVINSDTYKAIVKQLKPGESVSIDGIDISKNYYHATYDTVEELSAAEGVKFLYPSYLPDNTEILRCAFAYSDAEKTISTIGITTTDSTVTFSVNNRFQNYDALSLTEIGGYQCFVYYDDYAHAQFQHNGYNYAVSAKNDEDIKNIIDGLREISE